MTRYRLEMNEEQARTVIDALDFWMRMRIGQWEELTDLCLEPTPDSFKAIEKYYENRETANEKLFEARRIVMPELTKNASWGVYKFPETERAFNVMKAVRSCIAWHKNPNGGYLVIYDKPMAVNVTEPMPKCEAIEDAEGHKTADAVSD